MKVLCVVVFALSLTACTFIQKKDTSVAAENHALLQEQQALLASHSDRLQALSDAQAALLDQLSSLQSLVGNMGRNIKQELAAKRDVQPAASKVEKTSSPLTNAAKVNGLAIIGRVEYIWLNEPQQYLKARVDTGAKSSSLNATNIQPFERNGEPWVSFVVVSDEKEVTMEAPLERYIKIRQVSADALDRRPVVKLKIRVGELQEETEFTLSDRTDMTYPVLLGRTFLQDVAVVDVAKKFTRPRDPKMATQASTQ